MKEERKIKRLVLQYFYPFLAAVSAVSLSPSHSFSCSRVSLSLARGGGGGGGEIKTPTEPLNQRMTEPIIVIKFFLIFGS